MHLLRDRGAMSRAELVRASGLTKPTVMAIVKSLLEDGIAIESGTSAGPNAAAVPARSCGSTARRGRPWPCRFGLQIELTHVTATGAVLGENVLPFTADPDRFLAGRCARRAA